MVFEKIKEMIAEQFRIDGEDITMDTSFREDLDADSIVNAIIEGKYYSTQGPEFKQISVNGDTITAETSPVAGISFISDTFYVRERVVESDGLITEGRYKIKKTDRVVRVEITDADGKKAWSNYIVL